MQQWRISMEQIDYTEIQIIEKEFGSPFYLMDTEKYQENLNAFLTAFRKRYPNVISGYSFKTNYVPTLCNIAKQEGCYAEVVSEMELDLAIRLGFKNIIFNGPIKRVSALEKAIKHQAIINLDSEYETDFICNYRQEHKDTNIEIGLRVNVHLTDENGNSTIQCGLREGRFGFPHQILSKNIKKLRAAGVDIVSLHGHTSSSDRAVINYKIITEYMLSVCEEFQLNSLKFFDIGGGFFGAAPEGLNLTGKPTYDDYAKIVLDCALNNNWFVKNNPTIVIEPGSSVVSNVFTYYTKVYQIKHIGNKNFVMVDGTVFDVKPTMHTNNLPHTIITNHTQTNKIVYDIVGSTCMEKDVILHDVILPELRNNDYLQIRGVGAYTISLTPSFINYLAPILYKKEGKWDVARRRQNIDDITNIYKL